MITTTVFVFTLNTLCLMCQAVPMLNLKNTLGQNVLDTMVTSACTSNGGCWEWLSMEEVHKDVSAIPEDLPMSKINIQRQASSIDPNTVIETWGDNSPPLNRNIHQSPLTTKQFGNRLSKKDVMSRSWGAGGMPFSVLYMNPHGPRGNHASTTQQQEPGKAENPTPSMMYPNSRIALRNGNPTPRRQYSIIPQLFISYGWGPFGK